MAVISLELHDPQYQGFLDCPFDNLYGKPTLQRYIKECIPEWRESVIVSPDAGGAKRATAIADALGLDFSLIHKVKNLSSPSPVVVVPDSPPYSPGTNRSDDPRNSPSTATPR